MTDEQIQKNSQLLGLLQNELDHECDERNQLIVQDQQQTNYFDPRL